MVIFLHLVSALLALGLGTANLVLAKGTPRHRAVGAVWIAAMLCVTVSSFWIRELNPGALSWIHGLTVWTLFSMGVAVWAIRTGRVAVHAEIHGGNDGRCVRGRRLRARPGPFHRPAARLLSAAAGKGLRIGVSCPVPADAGSEKFSLRRRWTTRVTRWERAGDGRGVGRLVGGAVGRAAGAHRGGRRRGRRPRLHRGPAAPG